LGARFIKATSEIDGSVDFANKVPTMEQLLVKYSQEATGVGGVLSIDYKPMDNLNLALRYDSKVPLDFKTDIDDKTKANKLGSGTLTSFDIVDGEKYARDLPGIIALGASWDFSEKLNFSNSFTYYLEKSADWDEYTNDDGKKVKRADDVGSNAFDLGLSATYKILPQLWTSAGYLYTKTDLDTKDYGLSNIMSPPLSCNTLALGAGYQINENIGVNFGYMINMYEDASADEVIGKSLDIKYSRNNHVFALGMEYNL